MPPPLTFKIQAGKWTFVFLCAPDITAHDFQTEPQTIYVHLFDKPSSGVDLSAFKDLSHMGVGNDETVITTTPRGVGVVPTILSGGGAFLSTIGQLIAEILCFENKEAQKFEKAIERAVGEMDTFEAKNVSRLFPSDFWEIYAKWASLETVGRQLPQLEFEIEVEDLKCACHLCAAPINDCQSSGRLTEPQSESLLTPCLEFEIVTENVRCICLCAPHNTTTSDFQSRRRVTEAQTVYLHLFNEPCEEVCLSGFEDWRHLGVGNDGGLITLTLRGVGVSEFTEYDGFLDGFATEVAARLGLNDDEEKSFVTKIIDTVASLEPFEGLDVRKLTAYDFWVILDSWAP
ncbi:hypothetical protein QBC46DRAFT_399969 [Diplogelasinospora grovesii]|uniref:Uncharacterized protein n=1 Tax=Diplogelasinospora grovesii TaxID=303347 RepID=A0AAN6MY63_9PEZI|nr:hypothetical protein QBC46DRAFT_399969 [Diplogelasinospora grovesii]